MVINYNLIIQKVYILHFSIFKAFIMFSDGIMPCFRAPILKIDAQPCI